jgi:hypothetical protein
VDNLSYLNKTAQNGSKKKNLVDAMLWQCHRPPCCALMTYWSIGQLLVLKIIVSSKFGRCFIQNIVVYYSPDHASNFLCSKLKNYACRTLILDVILSNILLFKFLDTKSTLFWSFQADISLQRGVNRRKVHFRFRKGEQNMTAVKVSNCTVTHDQAYNPHIVWNIIPGPCVEYHPQSVDCNCFSALYS